MIDPALYARRRIKLAEKMQDGISIVRTAPERQRNRDSSFPYRFDSYFHYLTGFPEPEAVLVLVAGPHPKSVLFCRERISSARSGMAFVTGRKALRTRSASTKLFR